MNEPANKNDRLKKYEFKLLREEVVDEDAFEDQTHKKIADSLTQLIINEEKGITIGLEGSWGSGKSTVISLLKKELKKSTLKIPLVQFDAWAHEGDPLRRIFLESLIDEISSEYMGITESLKLQKEQISKHTVIKDIHTKQSTTVFATFFALSFALLPLGITLIDKTNFQEIAFSGKPYWMFISGVSLTLVPFLTILGNLLYLLKKKIKSHEKIFILKNWAFLQKNAQDTTTQESTEEDERTSIEFERDFNSIILEVVQSYKIDKLILVIDNLDRIDVKDSLKIWSTLQTFLQQRNVKGESTDWFHKVWIIVPYDSQGLALLWDKQKENDSKLKPSKSFFDKCFQLRLEVPKPVFTSWEDFTRVQIKLSLINWEKDDTDELIRILRLTRKDLNDIPTPREIKNYINQVGFLASLRSNEVSISSIAYYVIWRELYHASVDEIRSALIQNVLLNENNNHEVMLDGSIKKDLAALIFGVSPDKGYQLLILPEIASILQSGDGVSLKQLMNLHGKGFWVIFKYYVETTTFDISRAMYSAQAIHEGLLNEYFDECQIFVKRVEEIKLVRDNSTEYFWHEEKKYTEESNFKRYFYLFKLSKDNQAIIIKLYEFLIWNFSNYLRNNTNIKSSSVIIENLSSIITFIKENNYNPELIYIEELNLEKVIQLYHESKKKDFNLFKYFIPVNSIVDEITKQIKAGQTLPESLPIVIEDLLNTEFKGNWNQLVTQCKAYIESNGGQYSNQSDDIFKIINILAFKLHASIEQIKTILLSGPYYNLVWHRKNQNLIHASMICGYVFSNSVQAININHIHNSSAGYDLVKNFWLNSNINNAALVIKEMKNYQQWLFIWDLLKNGNKLAGDIITLAIDDLESFVLFDTTECLQKIKQYRIMMSDNLVKDKLLQLIQLFIRHASLEDQILEQDINIIDFDFELSSIIKFANEQVVDKIFKKLKVITKDDWLNALQKGSDLINLAIALKEMKQDFYLDNDYADALFEYISKIELKPNKITSGDIDVWNKLISIMSKSFQINYSEKITDYLCENIAIVPIGFYQINESFFNYKDIKGRVKLIKSNLDIFINENNFEKLGLLYSILSDNKEGKFIPEEHYSELENKPLNKLYFENEEDEYKKNIVKGLAEKFNVKIVKEVTPDLTDVQVQEGDNPK